MVWHLTGSFARPRGWRRRVVVTTLLVLTASVAWLLYQTRSANITVHASRFLSQLIGADFRIDSAQIGIDGVITLQGIELLLPESSLADRRVFQADQVLIHHSLLPLMRGRFHVQRLILTNPTLYVTEDLKHNQYNFSWLTPHPPGITPSEPQMDLPDLLIQGGKIRFGQINADRYEELGMVRIHGKLVASPGNPRVYAFTLGQELDMTDIISPPADQEETSSDAQSLTNPNDHEQSPLATKAGNKTKAKVDTEHSSESMVQANGPNPLLRGWFDYDSGNIEASLDHFTLRPWQAITLPSRVRIWWDRFLPQGTIAEARFTFNHQDGPRLELAAQDIQLTLPYAESTPRIADVAGRFVIDRGGLVLSGLTGHTDDFSCEVNGRVSGFALDSAFDLTIKTGVFNIPENPGYMSVLPVKLQNMFPAFAPSGQGRAEVSIRREAPSQPLKYQGTVEVINARLTYHRFPYPLTDLNGMLRFTDDLLEIVKIHGHGPSGAQFAISGAASPLSSDAAIDMTVVVEHLPIDDFLRNAVPPRAKKIIDVFLDRQAQQRMIDRGLIQSPLHSHQRSTQLKLLETRLANTNDPLARAELDAHITQMREALSIPAFELGGSTTVTVKLEKTYGPGKKLRATATVPLGGLRMMFHYLPYPVHVTGGQVVITPDLVRIDRAEGEGLTGGSGYLQGTIATPNDSTDRRLIPDLRIVVDDVPCDHLFRSSLPRRQRQVVEQMAFLSRFDAEGTVFQDQETNDIGYRVDAKVREGTAWPWGRDYRVGDIAGSLTIHRGWIEINQLHGQHEPTHWTLSGMADWRGEQPAIKLAVEAQELTLDEDLLVLLPQHDPAGRRYHQLHDHFRLAGVIDAQLDYTKGDQQMGNQRRKRETSTINRPLEKATSDPSQSPSSFDLKIQPHSLAFDLRDRRVKITEMTGSLQVLPDGVETLHCGGAFDEGHFTISGRVTFAPNIDVDVTLDLKAQRLGDAARAILPDAVRRLMDELQFDGPHAIHGAKINLSIIC